MNRTCVFIFYLYHLLKDNVQFYFYSNYLFTSYKEIVLFKYIFITLTLYQFSLKILKFIVVYECKCL